MYYTPYDSVADGITLLLHILNFEMSDDVIWWLIMAGPAKTTHIALTKFETEQLT